MEVVKTVRVPVHYALTKRKLSIVDKLTARLSYCAWLFSKFIEERNLNVEGYGELTGLDIETIAKLTKLSPGYVQQCRDQALWMWRSYRAFRCGRSHKKCLVHRPRVVKIRECAGNGEDSLSRLDNFRISRLDWGSVTDLHSHSFDEGSEAVFISWNPFRVLSSEIIFVRE